MRKAIILTILTFLTFQPVLALAQTNYRFTGQELDRETALYDYGARNYQPNTGRFIQQDPALKDGSLDVNFLNSAKKEELDKILSNPQRLNPYSYANNNPVKYIDPTGETPITPYDMTTDVMFFNQSLSDYRENKNLGNALALAADTIGVALPVLPAGTGGLFKGFVKGVNYLVDLWKNRKISDAILKSSARSVQLFGTYTSSYINKLQKSFSYLQGKGINIGEHALNSMFNKGFTVNQVEDVFKGGSKYWDKNNNNLNIIHNGIRIIIDPQTNKVQNILDIKNINSERFIKLDK